MSVQSCDTYKYKASLFHLNRNSSFVDLASLNLNPNYEPNYGSKRLLISSGP